MKPKLFADDASYLAHGFTMGLDRNLQYNDSIAEWKTPNQKVAAHPIGPGVLAAPFIAAFSVIDKVTHHAVILQHEKFQYSWSFFGFVFASVFFFIAGLFCYVRATVCLNFALSRKHLLFIASSFGILYYVLFRPVMGHSFEFFTIALWFWASWLIFTDVVKQKVSYIPTFWCALAIVLTMQIRPADINIFILPVIVFGFLFAMRGHRLSALEIKISLITLGCGILSLIVCFLPFFYINQQLYGMVYPTFHAMYGPTAYTIPAISNFSDFIQALLILLSRLPQILTICFSSEFGLLFSSAILFCGCGFLMYYLLVNIRKRPAISLFTFCAVGLYIGLPVAITLFWQSFGDAYGYRFLFCVFPLALLGYGFWHKQLTQQYGVFQNYPLKAKLLQVIILALCCHSLLGNALFGLNSDLMFKPGVTNSFGKEGGSAMGYNVVVLKSTTKGSTWLNLAATRVPGFFTVGLLDLLSMDIQELKFPGITSEKLDKFANVYEHPPLQTYLQVLLIALLFAGSYILFIKNDAPEKIVRHPVV